MFSGLWRVLRSGDSGLRTRILAIYAALIGVNILAWVLAVLASARLHDPKFIALGSWHMVWACVTPWTPTISPPSIMSHAS